MPSPTLGQNANTASSIDLRGVGFDNTLVLVDGRRMPELLLFSSIIQPDINPIPLHAVERVETLTGTAGGIHGFGALGGAVNVVLDRNNRGLDVYATTGLSTRGDSFQRSLELSYDATSSDGRTDLTLFVAHSQIDTPLIGDRDFTARDRAANPPTLDPGNSLGIIAFLDATGTVAQPNLVFKPAFGGASLPSNTTFLPTSAAITNCAMF